MIFALWLFFSKADASEAVCRADFQNGCSFFEARKNWGNFPVTQSSIAGRKFEV
jgi:hypothetical protein